MTILEAAEKVQEIISTTDWRAKISSDVVPMIELKSILSYFLKRVQGMQPKPEPIEEEFE